MLKSTEPEHVSAARPRPATQHLFNGQVLRNTPPPLSDQTGWQTETGNYLSEEEHDYKTQNTAA